MKSKLQLLFNSLLLLTILVCSTKGQAQINYTESFTTSVGGWSNFFFSEEENCDANGSIRYNLYNFNYNGETFSPSIGTSNGMPVTLTYDYKVVNWDELDAAAADWGFVEIYYCTSLTGPYTLIQTINSANHTSSATCAAKTVTFTPPAGMPVYIGIYAEQDDFVSDVWLYLDNFHATQPPGPLCTGAPVATTAVAATAAICSTQQASLSLTPFNASSGLTYQWQSSTDNVTYTNIAGATSSTYTGTQPGTLWYRAITTCAASTLSTTSAAVQVTSTGIPCMCDVTFPSGVEPITNVTFGAINNVTSDATTSPQRESFATGTPPIFIKGIAYPTSFQGNTVGEYENFFKVFIDFNQNGILDDAGESFEMGSISNSTGVDGQILSGSITIPAAATSGITNMRVVKLYNAYGEACNSDGFGQAEDYLVNIQPCTTTAPTAAATQTYCPGSTINNLVATGTAVKWYTAATGGNALPTAGTLVSGTYYAAQTTGGCEGPRTAVAVTVTTVLADDPADVTSCGPYTLPALTNGTYRTAANGGGTVVTAGTPITVTTTLYVNASGGTNPVCIVDNSFTVNVVTGVVADDPADVASCGAYTLPALSANNVYRTAANGAGTVVAAGTAVTETTTLYVYASTTTTPACTAENSFVVTVFNAVADDPADVNVCSAYTLPALTNGTYHTAANGGGTTLAAGTLIPATTTLYVFATANAGACTTDNSFTVTVTSLEVDELDDVTVCGEYILPAIENGTYYSGGNGIGQMYDEGDAITQTSTIHIFVQEGTCTAETTFTVTILNVDAVVMDDVDSCGGYTLPQLPAGSSYHLEAGGQGQSLQAGQPIDATTTIYIYTTSATSPVCTAESSFEIVVTNVEALGDQTFSITVEEGELTTLADYDLDADGTVDWYPNEQAAINQTPLLSLTTEIPMGTTTYYVRHRVGNCVSEPSTVTFTVTLGTDTFDLKSFNYYPNPVTDVLNVNYSQNINNITVYNLLGQQILDKQANSTSVQVDLAQLAAGTYLVKVQSDTASKVVKIVKNR